jgi:hypothetical protein
MYDCSFQAFEFFDKYFIASYGTPGLDDLERLVQHSRIAHGICLLGIHGFSLTVFRISVMASYEISTAHVSSLIHNS